MCVISKTKHKSRQAFTLVELIVVLVVLAIIAAITIPALTGYIKKTKKENLERAIKAFDTANAKITGIVVNRATMSKNGYYGYYYNDYYASGEKI